MVVGGTGRLGDQDIKTDVAVGFTLMYGCAEQGWGGSCGVCMVGV